MTDLPTPDDALDIDLRDRLATLDPPLPLDLATLDRLEAEVRAGAARARRRQHRRVGLAVGALAAAAALLVAVVAWPSSGGQESQRVTAGPTSTAPTTVAPSSSGQLVMASTDGRLQVLSATTGQVLRTITPAGQPGRVVTSLSTDAAGRYAYVSWRMAVSNPPIPSGVDQVTLATGAVTPVAGIASSDVVAISPDGTRLASAPSHAAGAYVVTVRDLGTDRSESWSGSSPSASYEVTDVTALSWSADARSLAVSHETTSTGSGAVSQQDVDLIDTTRPQSHTNPRSLGPATPAWTSNATYLGRTGQMAVLRGCSPETTCVTGRTLVSLDPRTGLLLSTATTREPLQRGEPAGLTSDPEGTLYLLIPNLCFGCQGGIGSSSGGGWHVERITDSRSTVVASGAYGPAYQSQNPSLPAVPPAFIAWVP